MPSTTYPHQPFAAPPPDRRHPGPLRPRPSPRLRSISTSLRWPKPYLWRYPIVTVGVPFSMYLPRDPMHVRWSESMLPRWNGSFLDFWSRAIAQVLSDGSASHLVPTARDVLAYPDFWTTIKWFLKRWVGPAYFVQEMQHALGPSWVPSYPLPTHAQLLGQQPTYVWTGTAPQHGGLFQKSGALLGPMTLYSRQVAIRGAKAFSDFLANLAAGNVLGPRFEVVASSPEVISRASIADLISKAQSSPTAPITVQACVEKGLQTLKANPDLWQHVVSQAGSEAQVAQILTEGCTKLVSECSGLSLDQCMLKLCPGMTQEQCAAHIAARFSAQPAPSEEESQNPWMIVGVGAALCLAAFGAAYAVAHTNPASP